MVNVLTVPYGLENSVGETRDQDILDGLLTQVMISTVDLGLVKNLQQRPIKFVRRFQIGPKWLFDDQAREGFAVRMRIDEAAGLKLPCADLEKARRYGEIEDAVTAGSGLGFNVLEPSFKTLAVGLLFERALLQECRALENRPVLVVNRTARVLLNSLGDEFAISSVIHFAAAEADQREMER